MGQEFHRIQCIYWPNQWCVNHDHFQHPSTSVTWWLSRKVLDGDIWVCWIEFSEFSNIHSEKSLFSTWEFPTRSTSLFEGHSLASLIRMHLQAHQPNPSNHPCLYARLPHHDLRTNHFLWQTQTHIDTPGPYVYVIGLGCNCSKRPKDSE